MPILTKPTIYIIEASIKNTDQWSVFTTNDNIVYANKSQRQLKEVVAKLKQTIAYSLLSFRVTPYQPMEVTSHANRTRRHLTDQYNSQDNQASEE